MDYCIALDSGGTKTNTIIFDLEGHIVHRDVALGCNPLDIGKPLATERVQEILRRAAEAAPGRVLAAYAATAGIYYYQGTLFTEITAQTVGVERLKFEEDGRSVLSSELSHNETGLGLICGTGCSAWVRKQGSGPLVRSGGWGYLLDTLGSGYVLGRDALHAICLAIDGRAPKTAMQELAEQEMGCGFVRGIPGVYDGGRRRIASFARIVFQAANQGDPVAREVMDRNAGHIANLIWWADPYFDEAYPVIAGGGIVTAFPEYFQAIKDKSPERANIILAKAPPVYGGAVEAMSMAGLSVDETFRNNFLADYAALSAE